jgi:hypothetical protein
MLFSNNFRGRFSYNFILKYFPGAFGKKLYSTLAAAIRSKSSPQSLRFGPKSTPFF